jgi:hypothetical protein
MEEGRAPLTLFAMAARAVQFVQRLATRERGTERGERHPIYLDRHVLDPEVLVQFVGGVIREGIVGLALRHHQVRRHRDLWLDALDHAGRQGGEQQFGRVEGLPIAGHLGFQRDHGVLAARFAGVGAQAHGRHVELHLRTRGVGQGLARR